jgi:peroxiredoxin
MATLGTFLILLAGVGQNAPAEPRAALAFQLQDFRGAAHSLDEVRDRKLVVLAFLGVECPLANQYAPKLVELAGALEPKGVAFFGIDANQQDGVTAMSRFSNENGLPFPFLKDVGKPDAYKHLQAVLTKPIDWGLIRRQYDQMVKYATAIRLGTAETEAILRRFTRNNVQHPTYKAFAELGKAVKTIFLCRYLHGEELRREIHEGLNVIEQWNGATDFVFFARRGELVSNRHEDHEVGMLALHLLQNCMVYINTLMLQQVLSKPHWRQKLVPRDLAALTPLIWEHVNPYGRFELDMNARIPLG